MNNFWQLIAGLGVFLLGMSFIERSLTKLGGARLKTFLQKHTQNPLKAVFGGTLATAILQSSSVISLIVLAFVGARMIQMKNALGIIIGANLGTTFTGWIVAFFGFKLALDSFSYPFLAVGLLGMVLLDRRTRTYQTTKIVAGFGFLLFWFEFYESGDAWGRHRDGSRVLTRPSHRGLFYFRCLVYCRYSVEFRVNGTNPDRA